MIKVLSFCLFFLNLASISYGRDVAIWVFTDYPKANYRNAEGQYSGFLHDIVIDVFEKRLGIAVDIAIFPSKRCQAMVKYGSADLMVTVPTTQRLEYTVTHDKPIWTKRLILFTYSGHPRIDSINRISGLTEIKDGGFTVISYIGNGWVENTLQSAGIPVLYATTVAGMYRMLSGRRGDLVVVEKSLALPLIKTWGFSDTIVETDGVASESGFHILISKKSKYAKMISRINLEIEKMRERGEIDTIIRRYSDDSD